MIAQSQPLEVRYHRLEATFRWILALALVTTIALVAVVAWSFATRADVPDRQGIATDLAGAWTAHDPTAAGEIYAESAIFIDDQGYVTTGLQDIKGYVQMGAQVEFVVTVDGPVMQDGNTVFFHSTQTAGGGAEVVKVLTVLTLNDQGLIMQQTDYISPPEPAE